MPTTEPALSPGEGALSFRRVAERTVVGTFRATSPLRFLAPKNHGPGAWVFVASFGGGLVDGDALRLRADVGPGAVALLGTQSSTKVYRGAASQRLDARVAAGGLFVSVPDPVACYAGAAYVQRARIALEPGASVVLVDGFTCGRRAHGERWAFARYDARTAIERDGRRAVTDALLLDPAHGAMGERFGRFDAMATLIALGPAAAAVRAAILAGASRDAEHVVAASPLGDDGALLRVAATSAERAAAAVRARLACLGDLLGDDPFARKW